MNKFNFAEFFEVTGAEIQARIERAGHYSHPSGVGDAREDVIREFLRDLLSPRFVVDRGKIVDSVGNLSSEFDVIISESNHVVPAMRVAGRRIIPIEAVYCVLEIKSKLTQINYNKFLDDVETLKEMRRFYVRVPTPLQPKAGPSKEGYAPSDSRGGIVWSGIIAFDAPKSEILAKYMERKLDSLIFLCIPGRELVMITIAEPGYQGVVYGNKSLPQLVWFIMNVVESNPKPHLLKPDFQRYSKFITNQIGDVPGWSIRYTIKEDDESKG